MENQRPDTITYYAHEEEIARIEIHAEQIDRHFKIACLAALLFFIAFVGTNVWWIHKSMSMNHITSVSQEASGQDDVYVNGIGNFAVDDEPEK